jgi:uncharacterized protein (UPF0210 family)
LIDFRTIMIAVDPGGPFPSPDRWAESLAERLASFVPAIASVRDRLVSRTTFQTIRIATTPVAADGPTWSTDEYVKAATFLEEICRLYDAEFVGGMAAFVPVDQGGDALAQALPDVLLGTTRVCAFLDIARTGYGLSGEGLRHCVAILRAIARRDPSSSLNAFARFAATANSVPATPFMPMGHKPRGQESVSLSVGIGMIQHLVRCLESEARGKSLELMGDLLTDCVRQQTELADAVADEIEQLTGAIVEVLDLSVGSVPSGSHGSVLTLMRLLGTDLCAAGALTVVSVINQAIRRGARLATKRKLALSRLFLSICEDTEILLSLRRGEIALDRLLALTAVSSVGLDMVALTADVSDDLLAGLIADQLAIACAGRKPASVRLILLPPGVAEAAFGLPVFGTAHVIPAIHAGTSLRNASRIPLYSSILGAS